MNRTGHALSGAFGLDPDDLPHDGTFTVTTKGDEPLPSTPAPTCPAASTARPRSTSPSARYSPPPAAWTTTTPPASNADQKGTSRSA